MAKIRIPVALAAASVLFVLLNANVSAQSLFGKNLQDALQEHDLLQAIKIPFDDPKTQFFDEGLDGFPVFGLRPGSDIKSPYRLFMPEKMYSDFSIRVTLKHNNRDRTFLFSVVNPLDTIVQLGVELIPAGSNTNISLLYTDVNNAHYRSPYLASFLVPRFEDKWTRFAIRVSGNNVTLFFNCQEMDTIQVKRVPEELLFDSASTLYVGQAGPIIKGRFDGSLQELKIYGTPNLAGVQCDNSFQGFGSGDGPSVDIDIDDDDIFRDDEPDITDEITTPGRFDGSGSGDAPPFPPPPPADFLMKGEKGDRGPKGAPGDSIRGPPGPPGPPGIPGSPSRGFTDESSGSGDNGFFGGDSDFRGSVGQPGPPGPPGQCFCNMSTLLENVEAIETLRGAPGLPGIQGTRGEAGQTGAVGPPGERGEKGPRGDKGDRGDIGATGPEGMQGSKGDPGVDGTPGVEGPPGPAGPPGVFDPDTFDESVLGSGFGMSRPGPPGPKGDLGDPGRIGAPGERGAQGDKGDRGDGGLQGPKGDRGHQGSTGPQGLKGEQGGPGRDGLPGLPGSTGQNGDKGEKGDAGTDGKPGIPGTAGPPGPPGTSNYDDALFGSGADSGRCSCDKGEPGDAGTPGEKGDTGWKGEKGESGAPGHGAPGPQGLPGVSGLKGERGERGPPGLPSNGTTIGSDFVAVKGDKGDRGQRGRRGKPGPAGPIGPPGKIGPIGDIGLPGWMGRPGTPGHVGPPGPVGMKGQKGESGSASPYALSHGAKGEKGERGYDGIPGRDGNPGAVGPVGPAGPPGSGEGVQYVPIPGPPGPPGQPGVPGLSVVGAKGEPGVTAHGGHVYGDPAYSLPGYGRQGSRSSLDELKALKHLKDVKDSLGPPGPPGPPGTPGRSTPTPDPAAPTRIVPGAVTFQNLDAMTRMSEVSPVGTLAYIIDEEALLVRVNKGWQYIALGSLLPISTPTPLTTTLPPPRPPANLQASNLVNAGDGPKSPNDDAETEEYNHKLRMAALNEPYTGDMHGVRGADYACYREARRAGLRGTFRAFISSRVQNIDSIVRFVDRNLPVVNTRGDILFNSWAEMFNGQGGYFAQAPRIYSFSGKNILTDLGWPQKIVWHGSSPQGERAMETYCDAWHSSSFDKVGLASSLLGHKLLDQEKYSCNNKFALLCIEATSQLSRRRRDVDSTYNETNSQYDAELNENDYHQVLNDILLEDLD